MKKAFLLNIIIVTMSWVASANNTIKIVIVGSNFDKSKTEGEVRRVSDVRIGEYQFKNALIIENYKNGLINGPYLIFDEEERLFFECTAIDGRIQGIGYFYDEKGKLLRSYIFHDSEVLEIIHYDSRGRVLFIYKYENNLLKRETWFYRNGRKRSVEVYLGDGWIEATHYKRNGKFNFQVIVPEVWPPPEIDPTID